MVIHDSYRDNRGPVLLFSLIHGEPMGTLRFEIEDVRKVAAVNKGKALLVHDEGVYLMPVYESPVDSPMLAFAEGCNPRTDEDYYERSRELVGGDDFGERIELSEESLAKAKSQLVIVVTEDAFQIRYLI
jgi:hypothetical protein